MMDPGNPPPVGRHRLGKAKTRTGYIVDFTVNGISAEAGSSLTLSQLHHRQPASAGF